MKPAIATVSLSGGLQEKLEAIASAGFRRVEIFENDLIAFPGKPADVRWLWAGLGLSIVTVQSFRDFEGLPEPRPSRTFDRAERKFDLLQELGTDLLFDCSSVSPEARAESTGSRQTSTTSPEGLRGAACGSAMKRSLGGVSSATTRMPGRSCAAPSILPSA